MGLACHKFTIPEKRGNDWSVPQLADPLPLEKTRGESTIFLFEEPLGWTNGPSTEVR